MLINDRIVSYKNVLAAECDRSLQLPRKRSQIKSVAMIRHFLFFKLVRFRVFLRLIDCIILRFLSQCSKSANGRVDCIQELKIAIT